MFKEWIQSFFKGYERLIVVKLLLFGILLGGALVALLILAMVLMMHYPAYVWCVWGGFMILWIISLLVMYGYLRIVKAEQSAHQVATDSIENCVCLIVTAAVRIIESYTNKKR